MKKVIVIGCPGSGKSTFSKALSQKTGLPLIHLDMLNWNADGTTVGKAVFREKLARAIEKGAWIIDGNYASTLQLRLEACDTVFFLDYPTEVCLEGVRARRGKPRSDIPWTETEEDAAFMKFIEAYNTESRPRVMALLRQYTNKDIIVFSARAEAQVYLAGL